MTKPTEVLLTILSRQQFRDEEPETTKLVTEGTMRRDGETVELAYEESELTGLSGTTTTFRMTPQRVELERRGAVKAHGDLMPAQHLDIVPVVYVLTLEDGWEDSQSFELA